MAKTAAWALGIALLGTAAALPVAWWARHRGGWVLPLLLAPLFLPQYLAYSGYGMLRAPGSWLGDLVGEATSRGLIWVPIAVGRVIAVAGLTLWVWPIGVLILAATLARLDDGVIASLRLEPMSRPRRALEIGRVLRPGLLMSVAAIAAVMAGSAVPLHLAQAPTLAIDLWAAMVLEPGDVGVWVRVWPLVLVAVVAAIAISRWATAKAQEADMSPRGPGSRSGWLAPAILIAASVLVPLGLFLMKAPGAAEVIAFGRRNTEVFAMSGAIAAACGGCGVLIAILAAFSASGARGRRVIASGLFIWMLGLLVPGIVIGAAWSWVLTLLPQWIAEQPGVLVVVHAARFGVVGVLAGLWLAGRESAEEARLRAVDGAAGPIGWFRAVVRWQGPGWLAAGLAMSALSLHEIEASVMVQPPGVPSLSQTILGFLHFARDDDMAAAVLIVVPVAIVLAVLAALLLRAAGRRSQRR